MLTFLIAWLTLDTFLIVFLIWLRWQDELVWTEFKVHTVVNIACMDKKIQAVDKKIEQYIATDEKVMELWPVDASTSSATGVR